MGQSSLKQTAKILKHESKNKHIMQHNSSNTTLHQNPEKHKLERKRGEWTKLNTNSKPSRFVFATVCMCINFLNNILPVLYMNPTKRVKIWKHVNFPIVFIIQVTKKQWFQKHKFKTFDYLYFLISTDVICNSCSESMTSQAFHFNPCIKYYFFDKHFL